MQSAQAAQDLQAAGMDDKDVNKMPRLDLMGPLGRHLPAPAAVRLSLQVHGVAANRAVFHPLTGFRIRINEYFHRFQAPGALQADGGELAAHGLMSLSAENGPDIH